jgi:hypothetical protein
MIFLEKAVFFGSYKSIGYDADANRVFGNLTISAWTTTWPPTISFWASNGI